MNKQYTYIGARTYGITIFHNKSMVFGNLSLEGRGVKRGVNVAPPLEYFFAVGGMF